MNEPGSRLRTKLMASSLDMCGLYQLGICAMIMESDWYFSSCGDDLVIISSDFGLCFMCCGGGGLKCGTLLWCTAVGLSRRGAGRGGLPPLAVPDPPPNIIWGAIGFLTRGLGTEGCIAGGWEWLCRWPGWSGSYINDCKSIAIIMHVRISYVCTWNSHCRVYSYIQMFLEQLLCFIVQWLTRFWAISGQERKGAEMDHDTAWLQGSMVTIIPIPTSHWQWVKPPVIQT